MNASMTVFYDAGGHESVPVQLETGRVYSVGSEPPNAKHGRGFVPLIGRNISPVQFTLTPAPDGWTLHRYGATPVWLDDVEIPPATGFPLSRESVVRVPNATITLQFYGAAIGDDGHARAEAWRLLQDQIHVALLEAYRDERGALSSSATIDYVELRRDPRFRMLLDRLAKEALGTEPDETINAAVSWALRKNLVGKVAGSRRANRGGRDDSASLFDAPQIGLYADKLAVELELKLDRFLVDEDLDAVNRGFVARFAALIPHVSRGDREEVARAFISRNIWDFIFNFGPVTDLMELDVVTEIMIVRHDQIYLERSGILERYGYAFTSLQQLEVLIRRIANEAGREITESNAMVDFRYRDGSRVNVISTPLSLGGPCVTIRKHRRDIAWNLDRLTENGALSPAMAWFLQTCVVARKNIIISGGTGSGKTTLLNALSAFIPKSQRVVTIEDTAELRLENAHVVSLQTKPATIEGRNEVDIRRLLRNALRMRPDRIIVGECRGGEAVDMLQALNTGHAGSMTTAHANSPEDVLMRLEVMVLQGEPNLPVSAIRRQVASAVDVVVQINRLDGQRRVTEICEVVGIDPVTGNLMTEAIFKLRRAREPGEPDRHMFSGILPSFVEEIDAHRPIAATPAGRMPVQLHEMFA